jgi:O-antigen/teichoic acid export membrane protein
LLDGDIHMTISPLTPEPALPVEAGAPARRAALSTVARNTVAMLAGQVIIKLLAFVFNVYVVRRLGATDYGAYGAALAFVTIFAMLTEWGTSALSVREMARRPEAIPTLVPDIMSLRAVLSVAVSLLVTGLAWLLGKSPDMVLGIFIASLTLWLYAYQGPLDALMIARERLDFSSSFNLLNQVVFITLGTLALVLGWGYLGLLGAALLGVLAMGLASHYVARRILKLHFEPPDPRRWPALLRDSLPFGVIGAITQFSQNFGVVFMSFTLTLAAVGWYNVPFNLIITLLLLAQSLALSIYPTMVKEYDSSRGSIRDTVQRAIRFLLLVSLPLAIGGMLLADRIVLVLYSEQYAPSILVMQIMVWALPFMFLAEIVGRAASTMHLERKAAVLYLVHAAITVGVNLALIPLWGNVGATVAMVISHALNVTLAVLLIGPRFILQGMEGALARVLATGALMGGVVWWLRQAPFLASLGEKVALLVVIAAGAVVYGLAALALRAITPGEIKYLTGAIQSRLGKKINRSA